jgi:hypothetical protein
VLADVIVRQPELAQALLHGIYGLHVSPARNGLQP